MRCMINKGSAKTSPGKRAEQLHLNWDSARDRWPRGVRHPVTFRSAA
jgi:hypothetical protein